jgi:hypothetical protein
MTPPWVAEIDEALAAARPTEIEALTPRQPVVRPPKRPVGRPRKPKPEANHA